MKERVWAKGEVVGACCSPPLHPKPSVIEQTQILDGTHTCTGCRAGTGPDVFGARRRQARAEDVAGGHAWQIAECCGACVAGIVLLVAADRLSPARSLLHFQAAV